MSQVGFFRSPEESMAARYKDGLLIREGFMTTRHGYPGVELGYPITQREDLPQWRSRDGTQMGPVFFCPGAPYNVHENSKGNTAGGVRSGGFQDHKVAGPGHRQMKGSLDLEAGLAMDPSFKNGFYYPYRRNHNTFYSNLPQVPWSQPRANPSNFEVKPDELRKWLKGTRA